MIYHRTNYILDKNIFHFEAQQLTDADTLLYEAAKPLFLMPPPTSCRAAIKKQQNWFKWRGASYAADRRAHYLHIHNSSEAVMENHKVLISAVLEPSSAFEYISKYASKKLRYQLKGAKATNLGYYTKSLSHPKHYSQEIYNVIHSSDKRQGRSIAPMFALRESSCNFENCLEVSDHNYQDINLGVFSKNDELVGYILGRRVGDHIQYDEIMGHDDHLGNHIMYLLHFEFLRECLKQKKAPTCLNYGPWYSGINPFSPDGGLNRWKRRYGFRPAYLVGLYS